MTGDQDGKIVKWLRENPLYLTKSDFDSLRYRFFIAKVLKEKKIVDEGHSDAEVASRLYRLVKEAKRG